MKNKILFGMLLLVILFCSVLFFHQVINDHKNGCTADTYIIEKGHSYDMLLDVNLSHGENTGVISVEGSYRNKLIRRDVYFSYMRDDDDYILKSTEVEIIEPINTITNSELKNILPDFFIFPEKKLRYTIRKQANNGYLFFVGSRPVLYCSPK